MNPGTAPHASPFTSLATVALLVLGTGVFAAGAISAADTLVGHDPNDRPLSRERALFAIHVVRQPSESTHESDGTHSGDGTHMGSHTWSHSRHPPPGIPALVTLTRESADGARSFETNEHGFLRLDAPLDTYTVRVETENATGEDTVTVREVTHLVVHVQDDGSMTFDTEHHDAHHPPFRRPPHHGAHAMTPGHHIA